MNGWVKKDTYQTINQLKTIVVYEYVGHGYFPEVVHRLQSSDIGKVLYTDYNKRIIEVTPDQANLIESRY